jgi:hypothetical protein
MTTPKPREYGILFQDPMVVALHRPVGDPLRKGVTRRTSDQWAKRGPGDRLWVRECFAIDHFDHWHDWRDDPDDPEQPECMEEERVYYRATPRVGLRRWVGPTAPAPDAFQGRPHALTYLHESSPLESGPAARVKRWTPSLLMPRWASRVTLEVVSVTREPGARGVCRAEILPDVDDAEARREGVADRAAYLALWRAINGDAVPDHVWRIEFREVSQ